MATTELVELVSQCEEGPLSHQSSGHRTSQVLSGEGSKEEQSGPFFLPHYVTQKAVLDGKDDFLEGHACSDLDNQGFAALHYAVMYHKVDTIKKLLPNCNPNVRTEDGFTSLHIAACLPPQDGPSDSTGHQMIRMLLESKSELVRAEDCQKRTPLHIACSMGNVQAAQELLKHIQASDHSIVNMVDSSGNTPLHEACAHGDASVVKELLKHNAPVKTWNYLNESPVHTACKKGFVRVVEVLVACDQSCVDLTDKQLRSPLHYAARADQEDVIKFLISKRCNKEMKDKDSVTPLLLSVKSGKAKSVRALIKEGCDVNTTDKDGRSAVYWAVREGHMDVLQVLLEDSRGIQLVHVPEKQLRNTPFHIAAEKGSVQAIELLVTCVDEQLRLLLQQLSEERDEAKSMEILHKGYEMRVLKARVDHLDFRNAEHRTPLHLAAISGNLEVIRLLTSKHPPSVIYKDCKTYTPLHFAVISGHTEVVRFFVHKYPLSLDEAADGNTPLHLATHHRRSEVVSVLIHEGADVAATVCAITDDFLGCTPLHIAAYKGYAEIVSLLVKANAPLEAKNTNGWTPLHLAAAESHSEIISLLIDAGADVDAKTVESKTPLFLACSNGHQVAAEVLMKEKADVTAQSYNKLNCLDVAVKNGHKNVALAIIHCKGIALSVFQRQRWKALRHSIGQMTPFRRMIQQMPSVAEAVLDHCMKTQLESWEHLTKVQFRYDFLEDYHDESVKDWWRRMIPSCFRRSASSDIASNACQASAEDTEGTHHFGNTSHSAQGTHETLSVGKNDWGPKFSAKDHPLAQMVKYKREDLLRHPVVTSLLEYKWRTYGGAIFLFNLITYLIFLLFLTNYALLLPHPDHRFCHNLSVTHLVASLPVNGTVCPFELSAAPANQSNVLNIDPTVPMNNHVNVALYFAAVMVIITAVARLLVVECFQLVRTRYRYFLKIDNCIELLTYVSSIIFVSHFGTNCWCPTNWQWQLGAIAVFLAWINLILFLKRVPLLGIYVLMFNAILQSFLKFALIAFLFVVAFCIAFYMILYKALDDATLMVNVSPFRNAGLSFIKTMVMTAGEFEYDSIFGHNNESRNLLTSFPVVAYILWIIFLIIMPILLTNLLVGLAVGDIKAIQDKAQLESNLLQIQADELLPDFIRPMLKKTHSTIYLRHPDPHTEHVSRLVCFKRRLRLLWGRTLRKAWGGERWDSLDNIKKCFSRKRWNQPILSPIEEVQSKTDQLSKEVKKLQREMSPIEEVKSQTEQLSREVRNLMEKNNQMQQLLMKLAEKQGIHLDPKETRI